MKIFSDSPARVDLLAHEARSDHHCHLFYASVPHTPFICLVDLSHFCLLAIPLYLLEPVKCKSNYPFLIVLLNVIKELTYNSDIQKMYWAYNTMITSIIIISDVYIPLLP